MKFIRSIRWRLQLWYGVLLVAVLSGFGISAYHLESARQMRAIDQELQRRVPVLVKSQHPVRGDRDRRELTVSLKDAALFDRNVDGGFYYVVWLKHGVPMTPSSSAPEDVPQPSEGDPPTRMRGNLREVFVFPGPGDCVLVGRSIVGDLAGLHQNAWRLAGIGSAVLLIGLAGGAWLVSRALKPVGAISSTAREIADGDLTHRIAIEETESELGQLAGVLNSTFARLDEAFNRQARFTADAAHELRTPLAVILTHTQNARDAGCGTTEHDDAFAAIERATQRMRGLTESLLHLARLDSRAGNGAVPCDLGQVARDATDLLRPLAAAQGLKIEFSAVSAMCQGNAGQLGQVVTNLVGNAIHHNQPGGKVWVDVNHTPDGAELTVSDSGPGISSEALPHVFERFYRADPSRSGAQGRAGLGLSIVRTIVDGHGGTITVVSEVGKGSTFSVHLPLAIPARDHPALRTISGE